MGTMTPEGERTIGQLVAGVTGQFQGLLRSEIALAKAEMTAGAKTVGRGAGILGGAAVFAFFAVFALLHTLAQVIAIWLPVWAGYLIVTVVLLVVAGALAVVGVRQLKRAKPVPERARTQATKTINMLSNVKPVAPNDGASHEATSPAASGAANNKSAKTNAAPASKSSSTAEQSSSDTASSGARNDAAHSNGGAQNSDKSQSNGAADSAKASAKTENAAAS